MVTKDYVSLHPEYGGGARGFRCEVYVVSKQGECAKVTRTESGMKMHLRLKHNIKIQGDLFGKPTEEEGTPAARTAGVQEEESELQSGLDEKKEAGATR